MCRRGEGAAGHSASLTGRVHSSDTGFVDAHTAHTHTHTHTINIHTVYEHPERTEGTKYTERVLLEVFQQTLTQTGRCEAPGSKWFEFGRFAHNFTYKSSCLNFF